MIQESQEFIRLLAERTPAIQLRHFDEEHWFESAYRNLDRRMILTKHLAQGEKNQCRKRLFRGFQKFSSLKSTDFDVELEDMIRQLAHDFTLTIGQAQKLINLLLKYHTCLFHSKLDTNWNRQNSWLSSILQAQHVPIDNVALYHLCRSAPNECFGFINAKATFPNKKKPKWEFKCSIYQAASDGKGGKVPWSKIEDYAVYYRLQGLIRTLSSGKCIPPILYEMRYLWKP